jgi:hypothetical protein
MHEIRVRVSAPLVLAALFACTGAAAQENPPASSAADTRATTHPDEKQPANTTEALQKATQNPVASLISVPLQNNTDFNIGSANRTGNVLNIQPVIPMHLTPDWNLVTRIIQPIVFQPYPDQNSGGNFGLGDMNPSFYLTPAKPGKLIWGVGPAFVLPTATDSSLGQGKWSIGPSFVALAQPGHWTLGLLVSNVWSFAGETNRPTVNQMLLQYFVNYNLKAGWYLSSAPIITANWVAPKAKDVWTVPFGGGVGRIMKVGFQPINLSAQVYANAVSPHGSSDWGIRLTIAFLFPKLTQQEELLLLEEKVKELQQEQQSRPK